MVVSNAEELWIYLPQDKKAIKLKSITPARREIYEISSLMGLNIFEYLRKGFSFTVERGKKYEIVAQPKKERKYLSRIEVKVNPIRWIIRRAKVYDKNGKLLTSTEYKDYKLIDNIWFPRKIESKTYVDNLVSREKDTFHHLKINIPIKEEKFQFNLPRGVEMIEKKE